MKDRDAIEAEAARQLSDAKLRSTPVRRAILAVLAQAQEPLDVPAILAKLPRQTDAVTVYRTLNTFVDKNLLHRVRGEERSWRYAAGRAKTAGRHQHPHFVCDDCGKVECLAASEVPPTLTRQLKVDAGYAVGYTEVIVHGSCAKCR